MHFGRHKLSASLVVGALFISICAASAAARKVHTVFLGAAKRVPYSQTGDPAGASPSETELRVRPLLVDGLVKEWTTGEAHDVTDRSFVIRRALRLNDSLPSEKSSSRESWVWQRGPWLLVDRVSGHTTALKLPEYDPGVSHVIWFRDYGAYCGLSSAGKNVYAIVAQLAARKPVLSKKIAPFEPANQSGPACAPPEWQREPLRITFHPAGKDPVSFDLVLGSAVLVEESDDEADAAPPAKPD